MLACRETLYAVFPYIPVAKQGYDIVKFTSEKKYKHAIIYAGGMFVCLITGVVLSIVYAPDIYDAFYKAGTDVDNALAVGNEVGIQYESPSDFQGAANTFTGLTLTWMVTTGTRIGGFIGNMVATYGGALFNCCSILMPPASTSGHHTGEDPDRNVTDLNARDPKEMEEGHDNVPLEVVASDENNKDANDSKKEVSQDEVKEVVTDDSKTVSPTTNTSSRENDFLNYVKSKWAQLFSRTQGSGLHPATQTKPASDANFTLSN